MDRLTYKCKCCNKWEKSVPAAWADVTPRFCGNSSCELSLKKGKGKKSFRSAPDMLEKVIPVKKEHKKELVKAPTTKSRGRKKKA